MAFTGQLKERLTQTFTPRKLRVLRESLTGYLFVAPALILIFIFGIFPVAFALYVSVHKWRIIRTKFIGLENYVKAVGNLAYVFGFFVAIGALVLAYILIRRLIRQARELGVKPWLQVIPGLTNALVAFTFLRYLWFQLPEFLDIATKLRGVQQTRALFVQLLQDAFYAPSVYNAWRIFLLSLGITLLVMIALQLAHAKPKAGYYRTQFSLAWIALGVGGGLLYFVYQQISQVYQIALETGTDPGIWPQVITISAGIILLILGWLSWNSAPETRQGWKFWLRILGAFIFLTGGWLLVGEIPVLLAAGDEDLWNGLKVTVFFSAGTVPFQLTISLFLAILLFQKVKKWREDYFN